MQCDSCGWEWTPRKPNPVACPECKVRLKRTKREPGPQARYIVLPGSRKTHDRKAGTIETLCGVVADNAAKFLNYPYRLNGRSRRCDGCRVIADVMAIREGITLSAAEPEISNKVLLDRIAVKRYSPNLTVTIPIEARIWDALEDRAESLGMRRNKYIAGVLAGAVNLEPLYLVEEPCLGCRYADSHPDAVHCGTPQREWLREPDTQWNKSCPPGRERIMVKVCSCRECSVSPPLQKS
jgi:hypothetical protein